MILSIFPVQFLLLTLLAKRLFKLYSIVVTYFFFNLIII